MMGRTEEITALTARYYELVGRDHHKDRDCHWYVEKRWSYGGPPVYAVIHEGYCYDRVRVTCGTNAEAEEVLIRELNKAIERQESIDLESGWW